MRFHTSVPKCLVNCLVVVFMIFTVMFLGLSSSIVRYMNNRVDRTVQGNVDDKQVLDTLRAYYLQPPPVKRYNIPHTIHYDPSQGQSKIIRQIFAGKEEGVFVECGAVDGEFLSNSLHLERALHWRGLLIEADGYNYKKLITKNRNAYISNACLSTSNQAMVNVFDSIKQTKEQVWWVKGVGKLAGVGDKDTSDITVRTRIQCFPFYSFMLALGLSSVDYFSLDVEGAELEILKTIPYDKIEIKVISVEWLHHHHNNTDLQDFLETKGYTEFKSRTDQMNPYEKIFIQDGVELNHRNV